MEKFSCFLCLRRSVAPKADPGPVHRARAPVFKDIFGFVFVIFDGITRTYFNCSQYAMYTVCILFSTRTTKTYGILKGHQNNPLTQRFLPRRDRVPRF